MTWKVLPLPGAGRQLPPLLVSADLSTNSYNIRVTDLTYIWSESLDRRDIIKRAFEEDTPIDPSEDSQQMRQLLDKLRSGLASELGTSLSLRAGQDPPKSGAISKLVLSVTAELPAGFQNLEWPIKLQLCEQSIFAAHFTLPLLYAQQARMQELQSLAEVIKDKDHVIQKLADKVEASGAELGHVFAGAAGKGGRKVSRKYAEDRVKGLGPFDVEAWRSDLTTVSTGSSQKDIQKIVRDVFDQDGSLRLSSFSDAESNEPTENWWEKLGDVNNDNDVSMANTEDAPKSPATPKFEATEDPDDDFQVQATPDRLHGRQPPGSQAEAAVTDETDDENDLDEPLQSQRSLVPDSVPLSQPKAPATRKLGTIGGKQGSSTEPKETAPEPRAEAQSTDVDDSVTEEEDNAIEQPVSTFTSRTPANSTTTARTKRTGLGRIGGRREKTPSKEDSSVPDDEVVQTPRRKLGQIGHRTAATHADEEAQDDQTKPSKSEASKTVKTNILEPVETEEARANRRRQELKRELEEKSKAPLKKKRKF